MKTVKISASTISKKVKMTAKKKVKSYSQYVDNGSQIRPAGNITLTPRLDPGVYQIKSDMQGLFFEPIELETDDLLRFEDKRQQKVLSEVDKFWSLKARFKDMGYLHKRGMLLWGEPGTGKSCILKLVIGEVVQNEDIVFIVKDPGMLVGALETIRQVEPDRQILAVLEDVDEMVRYNEHALLGLFDGDSQEEGMLVLGTTNYLSKLPPRMIRTGRFDRNIEIGNFGPAGRKAYFNSKLQGKEDGTVIDHLVKVTQGFNFSQVKEVIVSVYCLGYELDKVLRRIKGGTEPITEEREQYLEDTIGDLDEKAMAVASAKIKTRIKTIKRKARAKMQAGTRRRKTWNL